MTIDEAAEHPKNYRCPSCSSKEFRIETERDDEGNETDRYWLCRDCNFALSAWEVEHD